MAGKLYLYLTIKTEQVDLNIASDFYLGGSTFESRSGPTVLAAISRIFSQSLEANPETVP